LVGEEELIFLLTCLSSITRCRLMQIRDRSKNILIRTPLQILQELLPLTNLPSSELKVVEPGSFTRNKAICRQTGRSFLIRYSIFRALRAHLTSLFSDLQLIALLTSGLCFVRLLSEWANLAHRGRPAREAALGTAQTSSSATMFSPGNDNILYHHSGNRFVFFQCPRNIMLSTSARFDCNF